MDFGRKNRSNVREKSAAPPSMPGIFNLSPTYHIINTTLAGVAQSVERVALITAKRSTSRSWVRAPPSAIPISKLIRAAVLLLFARLIVSASSMPSHRPVWSHRTPHPSFHTTRDIACQLHAFLPDKEASKWRLVPFSRLANHHGD
jgi:hypothetical protein